MGGDNSDLKSIVYYIVVPVAYANWDLQYGGSGSWVPPILPHSENEASH